MSRKNPKSAKRQAIQSSKRERKAGQLSKYALKKKIQFDEANKTSPAKRS